MWPAVAINDTRTYAVMQKHNELHHNADKVRAAVDVYGKLVASEAAAHHRPDAWSRKYMSFVALAMVG